MRPCEERAVYICPSTYHVPCFSAQLLLCYSVTNSLRGRECRLWTCGLPFSIEDSAHNLRYPIHSGLLVSLASFFPSVGVLKSIMRPKLCCVLQRCCRLDMHLVEGGRNFAVHEILAQFFHITD